MRTKRIWILILLLLEGIACLTACAGREQPESISQMESSQEESSNPSAEEPIGSESVVTTDESVSPCPAMKDCIFRESAQTCGPRSMALKHKTTMQK